MKNLFFAISYSALQAVAAFGVTIVMAREVDPFFFGVYLLGLNWALMLVQIIDGGLEQCFTSFRYAFGLDVHQLYSNAIFLKVLIGTLCLFLIALAQYFLSVDLPLITLVFMVPALYPVVVFEVQEKLVLFAKILLIEKLFFFGALAIYLQFFSASFLIYLLYFCISVTSLCYQYWSLRLLPPKIQHFSPALISHYVSRYWPVYVGMLSLMIIGVGSRLIMEHKLGVAVFASVSIVFTLTNSINIVNSQIEKYSRPIISRAAARLDIKAMKSFLISYFKYYIMPLIIGCFLIGFIADKVIELIFGSSWVHSGAYLKVLVYMVIWTSIIRMSDLILVALGKVKFGFALSTIVAAGLTLFLLMLSDTSDVSTFLMAIMVSSGANALLLLVYVAIQLNKSSRETLLVR